VNSSWRDAWDALRLARIRTAEPHVPAEVSVTWASGPERSVYGWAAGKDDWNDGCTKAVCTVIRTGGTQTSEEISTPGTV
jgi:hypothetical protein